MPGQKIRFIQKSAPGPLATDREGGESWRALMTVAIS